MVLKGARTRLENQLGKDNYAVKNNNDPTKCVAMGMRKQGPMSISGHVLERVESVGTNK